MRLKEYFVGVAAKRLSAVEADPSSSHQHEFNGVQRFRELLGDDKVTLPTVFLYMDDEHDPVRAIATATWYDARERHATRTEYRLYFPSTEVSELFSEGDLLFVARRANGSLLIIAAPCGSTVGEQLLWLFHLDTPNGQLEIRDTAGIDRDVDYVVRQVLESIGIEAPPAEADPELITRRFGKGLPSTRVFSAFAREQAAHLDASADPDAAVIGWLETEERFFRAFERLLVADRLRAGFVTGSEVDVDGFVEYSLGVHNRRKSRAGFALENHLEHVFTLHELRFARGATTENRSKPDFLFPGKPEYDDAAFADSKLAILGAKASCKDRWRQVLGEADRVWTKHLITLEPSISSSQTDEMRTRSVQLVLPRAIHATYSEAQQSWIWTLRAFIDYIRQLQR